MINLLSPEDKKQLRAARVNSLLLRYYLLGFLVFSASGLALAGGFYIADQNVQSARLAIDKTESDSQNYASVQQRSKEFENNLKVARQILAAEVVYSKMITDIANTIPSGTVLNSLSLTPETINKKINLSFRTKDYDKGIKLKTTLENSNMFDDVSIVSITKKGQENSGPYPTDVNISATFHPRKIADIKQGVGR